MNKITFFITCVVVILGLNIIKAQEITRHGRFSYEVNVGTFTNEYTRYNNNFGYYRYLKDDFLLGFIAGRTKLSANNIINSKLESQKLFLRKETQTQFSVISRYYPFEKKFTPIVEARLGVNIGDKTSKATPTASLLLGYAIRFKKGGSINLGYHPQYVQYYASTYYTDAVGETVYRINNFHPVRRVSHQAFLNFIF